MALALLPRQSIVTLLEIFIGIMQYSHVVAENSILLLVITMEEVVWLRDWRSEA
jgi:hypothetical protein